MPKLQFRGGPTLDVEKGISILEAALRHHVPLYHSCGGNCSCSTCRVLIVSGGENLSEMETTEAEVLDSFDLKKPHRLGCQTLLLKGTIEVDIPPHDKAPRPNKTPLVPK